MFRAQLLNNYNGNPAVSAKNFSGQIHIRILPLPYDDFIVASKEYVRGAMIQEAFPDLSPADRDFLITGGTPADWFLTFAGDEEGDPEEDLRVLREEGPNFMTREQYQLVYAGTCSSEDILIYNRKQIESKYTQSSMAMAV